MARRLFCVLALLLAGCHSFDSSHQPAPLKDGPVVVFVYGLCAPEHGNGLKAVQQRVAAQRPDMTVTRMHWDDRYADYGGSLWAGYRQQSVVLVGHSLGGDRIFQIARHFERNGRRIALLIALDPVPITHTGFANLIDYQLPESVDKALCVYRHPLVPPFSCRIIGGREGTYTNWRMPFGHSWWIDAPRMGVQDRMVEEIVAVRAP